MADLRCACGRRIIPDCSCGYSPAFRCEEGLAGYGGGHPHHHQDVTDPINTPGRSE